MSTIIAIGPCIHFTGFEPVDRNLNSHRDQSMRLHPLKVIHIIFDVLLQHTRYTSSILWFNDKNLP